MATKADVKNWFKRGLKPLEAQFHEFFDSIFWKTDGIEIANVNGLSDQLAGKADLNALNNVLARLVPAIITPSANTSWTLPIGLSVAAIGFVTTDNMTIRIGTTNGGDEVMEDTDFTTGTYLEFQTPNLYANGAVVPIYFSGITAETKIIIYKK